MLRFHLRVGARVALTAMVVPAAVAAGALMFLQPEEIADLAAALFGPRAGLYPAAALLGLITSAAALAAPRVCTGAAGWLAHLPVAGTTHRRAAGLAVAVAASPLLLGMAVLAAVALIGHVSTPGNTLPRWAGLPVLGLAAAEAVLPLRRRLPVQFLALAAGLLAALGRWSTLAAAVPLLLAADLAAGRRRRRPATSGAAPATATVELPPLRRLPLPPRLALRALRWRIVPCYLATLPPLAAAAFFLHNNRLDPAQARRAALLGGALACVALLAALAGALAERRPAWPWARSLPVAAARRVRDDALLLGLACLPPLAATALLCPVAAAPLAATVPLLAAAAAAALRRPPAARLGARGELTIEGLLAAALVSLLPWTALALLAAAPLALRAAAHRERELKVSLWLERHHLAAGDPLSWSGG